MEQKKARVVYRKRGGYVSHACVAAFSVMATVLAGAGFYIHQLEQRVRAYEAMPTAFLEDSPKVKQAKAISDIYGG